MFLTGFDRFSSGVCILITCGSGSENYCTLAITCLANQSWHQNLIHCKVPWYSWCHAFVYRLFGTHPLPIPKPYAPCFAWCLPLVSCSSLLTLHCSQVACKVFLQSCLVIFNSSYFHCSSSKTNIKGQPYSPSQPSTY